MGDCEVVIYCELLTLSLSCCLLVSHRKVWMRSETYKQLSNVIFDLMEL